MGGLIAYRRNRHQPHTQVSYPTAQAGRLLLGVLPALLLVALATLAGCSTLRFYQQAVTGQVRLLAARQDVDLVLARQNLDPALRAALLDSQTALDFAQTRLQLASDGRYGSYVDLKREFVVWNLVVTPVDSVQPLTWCFPWPVVCLIEAILLSNSLATPQQVLNRESSIPTLAACLLIQRWAGSTIRC